MYAVILDNGTITCVINLKPMHLKTILLISYQTGAITKTDIFYDGYTIFILDWIDYIGHMYVKVIDASTVILWGSWFSFSHIEDGTLLFSSLANFMFLSQSEINYLKSINLMLHLL